MGVSGVEPLQRQSLSGRRTYPWASRAQGLALLQLTLARSPQVYAASARLSIQEEEGAGKPGRNYDSQDALRRRAFTTGQ